MLDITPQLSVPPVALATLQAEMDTMVVATGRDMGIVSRNTARDLTFEIIRRTPIAKRYQSMRVKGGGMYWVATLHRYTRAPVLFPGSKTQAQKYSLWGTRKRILGRGYAKAVMFPVLRGLGIEPRSVFRGRRKARDPAAWTVFRDQLRQVLDPSVTIGSNLPYIDKLDRRANILGGASMAVAGKMRDRSARIIERNAQRTTTRLAMAAGRLL